MSTPYQPGWMPETPRPEVPSERPASGAKRAIAIVVGAVLIIAAGVAGALIGYNQGVAAGDGHYKPIVAQAQAAQSAAAQERDRAVEERDRAAEARDAAIDERQRVEDARAAQAAEDAKLPDLAATAARFFDQDDYYGDAESLSITIMDSEVSAKAAGLIGYLDELGFSSAVIDRISGTRALDGTQTAEGDNCNVSWTYHPDNGLRMVFESARN